MNRELNGKDYWDERFRGDWRELGGPQQTEMFARVALRMLPPWLCADVDAHATSMLDAGCAEGEAVALLRARFGASCRVEGMDFSEEAVARAVAKHGDGFRVGDIRALESAVDVIFSSNTLEHLPDPIGLLEDWARKANDHIVLLLPFWEWRREPEHVFTFEHAALPAALGERFVCTHIDVSNTARLPDTHWNGFQALVVYSSIAAVRRMRLSVDAVGRGLQPGSLSADDVVAARAFGATMQHAAALAAEPDGHAAAAQERLAQSFDAIQTLGRSIEAQAARGGEAGAALGRDVGRALGALDAIGETQTRSAERLARIDAALDAAHARNGESLGRVEAALAALEAEARNRATATRELVDGARDAALARIDAIARRLEASIARQGDVLGEKIHILEAQVAARHETRKAQERADADLETARLVVSERLLKQELERERERIAGLLSSTSWRLTAPLRALAGAWYRLSRRAPAPVAAPGDAPALPAADAVARAAYPTDIAIVDEHRDALREILDRHAGQPIIVLRPVVDWDLPLFQRPHHVASRLARAGYLYFYCTPNGRDGVSGFRRIDDNLYLTDQFLLVNRIPGGKILHLYSTDNHCTPEYVEERLAAGDRLMYEYIDEIHPTISGFAIPPHVMEKHALLLSHPDVLRIASADKLHAEARRAREGGLVMATNGVEHEHFHGRGRENPPEDIADLVELGKPIVGYFGAFAVWFDYELVARLAAARPDYTILLLGWDYDGSLDRSGIRRFPNVRVLGPIPYRELPDYARFFDVSTIPFLLNDVTESTSPIKLFEYMSLEHPIVTTNLPECRKYASVIVARDHGQFVAQVDRALDLRGDAATLELLRADARANTWDSKAAAIAHGIAAQWPECAPAANAREESA